MKNKQRDIVRLKHISIAINRIEKFCEDAGYEQFIQDEMMQEAVIRQLEIIGEASAHISDQVKSMAPDVEWNKIKGLRNLIAHEYFRIDLSQIWETVNHEIPELKDRIRFIILGI